MNNTANHLDQDPFYPIIDDIIDFYHEYFIDSSRFMILSYLDKLKILKQCHGQNHPSMPCVLNHIGNILAESCLSEYSIVIFLEQLRIERYYLGSNHLDIAPTLNRIGEIYSENHQFSEAEVYFSKAFFVLDENNTKGRLYARTMFNTGLVAYNKSSYIDALEIFEIALKEQRATFGEFHSDVAEMCVKIGDVQLELGKLTDAIENYLEALMITRMINGNTHTNVCKILNKIGFAYQEQGEHIEALNAFDQALKIIKNDEEEEHTLIIHILHQKSLIYLYLGDIDNTIAIYEEVVNLIKSKVGETHFCVASVLGLLNNTYVENGMIESSKIVTKEISDIFSTSPEPSCDENNDDFVITAIKLFGCAIDCSSLPAAAA